MTHLIVGVSKRLGASFAQFEMRVVLSTVLSALRLSPADESFDDTTRRAVTLVPRRGVRVTVDGEREQKAAERDAEPISA